MSRVGRMPIPVPDGVKVSIADGMFVADGPKGKVSERLIDGIPVKIEDGVVTVSRSSDSGEQRSLHGLMRALLANAVTGVVQGFTKKLEIHGVGYRAEVKGKEIHFALDLGAVADTVNLELLGEALDDAGDGVGQQSAHQPVE